MTEDKKDIIVAMPATFTDAIQALRQFIGLVKDVTGMVGTASEALQRKKGKKAARQMDVLTFPGDGSRRNLERIAAGDGLPEDFEAIEAAMAETGEAVESSFKKLKASRNFIRERFGLQVANKINDLIYSGRGKESIRLDLSLLARMEHEHYTKEDVASEANRILENIHALNAGLAELHDLLMGLEKQ